MGNGVFLNGMTMQRQIRKDSPRLKAVLLALLTNIC